MEQALVRRRSPSWVRAMGIAKVHGLAIKLWREWQYDGITDRQRWLLEAVLSELSYRRRHMAPSDWCTCELCLVMLVQAPQTAPRAARG